MVISRFSAVLRAVPSAIYLVQHPTIHKGQLHSESLVKALCTFNSRNLGILMRLKLSKMSMEIISVSKIAVPCGRLLGLSPASAAIHTMIGVHTVLMLISFEMTVCTERQLRKTPPGDQSNQYLRCCEYIMPDQGTSTLSGMSHPYLQLISICFCFPASLSLLVLSRRT
jgi:hypothetical protein